MGGSHESHQVAFALAAAVIASGAGVAVVISAAGGAPGHSRAEAAAKSSVIAERGSALATQEQYTVAAASDGTFTAITPYRAWDTRVNEDDKLRRGDDFNVDMLTNFQGVPQIPATATAISFNVTVTATESGFGFVTIFNGDATAIPRTSTINWALPNFTIANGGIVALGAPGPYVGTVGVAMDGAADAADAIIVDVTGYYTP